MDEPQKKPSHRHEGRPRKVRFKISSSYSGRVLKQVYEDGQELEPPAKEHSRRFLRHSFEPGDRFPGVTGRRAGSAGPAGTGAVCTVCLYGWDAHKILPQASPILDFGKIIIYTNNLKIIRAPMDQKELMRRIIQAEGVNDWAFIYREQKERFGGGHKKDVEKKAVCNQYVQVRENTQCCFSPKSFGC
ncbi:GRCR2 protein, partial [Columbina picui]|nr:GRCR2 protein [Columbina picui]